MHEETAGPGQVRFFHILVAQTGFILLTSVTKQVVQQICPATMTTVFSNHDRKIVNTVYKTGQFLQCVSIATYRNNSRELEIFNEKPSSAGGY